MRDEKARGPEGSRELRKPVQEFDSSSVLERLKKEKAYQEHGGSGLTLAHEPTLRVVLTAVAAGRRTSFFESGMIGPTFFALRAMWFQEEWYGATCSLL